MLNTSSESEDESPPNSQLNSTVVVYDDSDDLPPDGNPMGNIFLHSDEGRPRQKNGHGG